MSEPNTNCPNNWKIDTLINLAEYYNGAAFKSYDWSEDGLPIIRIEQLNKPDSKTDKFNGFLPSKNCIDNGDLIFSWSATLKVVIWSGGSGALNQHLYKVVPKSKIDILLLLYILDFNMEKLAGQSQGSTMKHVTRKELSHFKVNFPSDHLEQKKIATILKTIDQTIEKTEALIKKYQQIKAGLMHDLFTRGITADGKLRPPREQAPELYQETPIGWIPKDWEVDQFGQRVSIIDPNPSHRYPVEVLDGISICSTENFEGEDGFVFRKSRFVSEEIYIEQNSRCRFDEKDVVFARKGKLGLARRYGNIKKVFSHTVVIMKSSESEVNPSWLLWLSRSKWLLKAIDVTMNTNSGVPTLGVAFIKNIKVPFPKIDEQKNATLRLDAVSKKIHTESKKLNKFKLQKQGLMQDLLTGKVRVNIDNVEISNG